MVNKKIEKSDIKKEQKAVTVSPSPVKAYGTGRRKTAVARVWLRRGKGRLMVNGKKYTDYFDTEVMSQAATVPFRVCPVGNSYDVHSRVHGGGKRAQADAVKLGISRAFVQLDEALRSLFRQHGLLTVDSRQKERKKYGQRGARRKFQFVKR